MEKYTANELSDWLFEKAERARNPTIARKEVMSMDQRGRSTTMLGRLYFYKYSPIYGDKMSKFDKFPLCVPIERYNNGFLGVNLHYLPAASRAVLLEIMLGTKSEQTVTDDTIMRVNYQRLKSVSRVFNLAQPCIHRYIFNQVRSKFIEIYPREFDRAIQLPVDDWVFNQ